MRPRKKPHTLTHVHSCFLGMLLIPADIVRFTVTSRKTERYGKASRVVPIFPELRSFLDNAYY